MHKLLIIADDFPAHPERAQFYLDGTLLECRHIDLQLDVKEFPRAIIEIDCSVATQSPGGPPPPNPLEKTIEVVCHEGLDEGYLNPDTEPTGFNARLSGWQANVYRNAYTAGQLRRKLEQKEKWRAEVSGGDEIISDAEADRRHKHSHGCPGRRGIYDQCRCSTGLASPVPFTNDLFSHEPLERLDAPIYVLPDGRTVSVGRLEGDGRGYGFVFTRPMPDGRTSELKFALTNEAAMVVLALLSGQFTPGPVPYLTDLDPYNERDSFEKRCRACGVTALSKSEWGLNYLSPHVQTAWIGWQDRAALAKKEADQRREKSAAVEKAWADVVEDAWGIIANVSGGNWNLQSAEWMAAAKRWRDAHVGGPPKSAQYPATHPNCRCETAPAEPQSTAAPAPKGWNEEDRPKTNDPKDLNVVIRRGEYDGSFGKYCPPPQGIAEEWEHVLYATGHERGNRKFQEEIMTGGKGYWLMHPGTAEALNLKVDGFGTQTWYVHAGLVVVTDKNFPRENPARLCIGLPPVGERKTYRPADGRPLP